MSSRQRRRFEPAAKVAMLRCLLLDQMPVSDLCDEYDIQPTVFYRWQKQLFENGAAPWMRCVDRFDFSPLPAAAAMIGR